VFLALLYALAVSPCAAQGIAGMQEMLDGAMLPSVEVETFEHTETLYPSNIAPRGPHVREFERNPQQIHGIRFQSSGRT
jgi:hypothetical protein